MVPGFKFCGIHVGIKKNQKPDLGLVVASKPVPCAGVFTTNQVVAAPVVLSRSHLAHEQKAQAIIINSGNANACTGQTGDADALSMAEEVARLVGCKTTDVQVCSTGVIGAYLPMDKIAPGIESAFGRLDIGGLEDFGDAICTTDTFRKLRSTHVSIGGRQIHIAGVSKGAGMIHPNMATMLGVVLTDAPIDGDQLQALWTDVCGRSFNAITVDGDTSTNDTALIMASGVAGGGLLVGDELAQFKVALHELTLQLAKDIVRDAEGGTKVVEITVSGANSVGDAKEIAQTIALSPLVKTALHGEDPNWGRIIAAAGRSGITIDPSAMCLSIGEHAIYDQGRWTGEDNESCAHETMKEQEYTIHLRLGLGDSEYSIYTCDLSAEYVSINADYRS